MSVKSVAMQAYTNALQDRQQLESKLNKSKTDGQSESFAARMTDSLAQVNEMQLEKKAMIESFAAGETQNVHELMIHIQKAGVAMNVTSAVRSKVMQAYQEVMRMQI